MSKILFYNNKRNNVVIIISLIVSIVITNSFIVFSPDENSRSYFSNLTSTITVVVPLIIAFIMVVRYKRSIRKNKRRNIKHSHNEEKDIHNYYDNNKMHLSICLFLVLWFVAHVIWTFQFQQASAVSIADALWFIGFGFFGYFLYSLYYHFFRKEFEPFILILMAIGIIIILVFVLDIIVSTMRLLSTQTVDVSVLLVTVVYPILDAVLIFPAVLIFWAVRRVGSKQRNTTPEEKVKVNAEGKSSFILVCLPVWILLLSISMILSAIGDMGFAYSAAYGPDTVQRDVWIWDIFYNSSGLCLAAALIGYKNFFSFHKIDTLKH